eukprot:525543_1
MSEQKHMADHAQPLLEEVLPPIHLHVTQLKPKRCVIAWKPPMQQLQITGYDIRVYERSFKEDREVQHFTVSSTSWKIFNLEPQMYYRIHIYSQINLNISDQPSTIQFLTPKRRKNQKIVIPDAPENARQIIIGANEQKRVLIAWESPKTFRGVVSYKLLWRSHLLGVLSDPFVNLGNINKINMKLKYLKQAKLNTNQKYSSSYNEEEKEHKYDSFAVKTIAMDNNTVTESIDHSEIRIAQIFECNISAQDKVRIWLTDKIKLPQYFDLFIKNGCDGLDIIADMNQDDLQEIGINREHRKKILKYIKLLNQPNYEDIRWCDIYAHDSEMEQIVVWLYLGVKTPDKWQIQPLQNTGFQNIELHKIEERNKVYADSLFVTVWKRPFCRNISNCFNIGSIPQQNHDVKINPAYDNLELFPKRDATMKAFCIPSGQRSVVIEYCNNGGFLYRSSRTAARREDIFKRVLQILLQVIANEKQDYVYDDMHRYNRNMPRVTLTFHDCYASIDNILSSEWICDNTTKQSFHDVLFTVFSRELNKMLNFVWDEEHYTDQAMKCMLLMFYWILRLFPNRVKNYWMTQILEKLVKYIESIQYLTLLEYLNEIFGDDLIWKNSYNIMKLLMLKKHTVICELLPTILWHKIFYHCALAGDKNNAQMLGILHGTDIENLKQKFADNAMLMLVQERKLHHEIIRLSEQCGVNHHDTFMDELYKHVYMAQQQNNNQISVGFDYLCNEEYDTDALKIIVEYDVNNVEMCIDKELAQVIKQLIHVKSEQTDVSHHVQLEIELFQIYVKELNYKTCIIDKVSMYHTIFCIKQKIETSKNIPMKRQMLMFDGNILENKNHLFKYCVSDQATLHLIVNNGNRVATDDFIDDEKKNDYVLTINLTHLNTVKQLSIVNFNQKWILF